MTEPLDSKRDLARLLGREAAVPADETPLAELSADSFGLVELAFRVESELRVRLNQEDLVHARTFGELATLVDARRTRR